MKSQKQTTAAKDATFSKQMAKAMMPFAECYAAFLESRGIKAAEQYIEAYGDASDPPPIGAAPVVGHGDSDVQGVSKGRAPIQAKSFTVPQTESLPTLPPGKLQGDTINPSVVMQRRPPVIIGNPPHHPLSCRHCPSDGGICRL